MKNAICLVTVLTFLAAPALVLAQSSDDDDSGELDEIIVKTTRQQKSIRAIPQTVTVIPETRIEQSKLLNDSLAGILELNVPGFGPSSDKLAGRGETLRGRNPLYLIDGVPQHNPLRDSQRDGHHRYAFTLGAPKRDGFSSDVAYRLTSDDFEGDGLSHHISVLGGYKTERVTTSLGVAYAVQDLYHDGNGDPVGLYATQGDTMDSSTTSVFFKTIFEPADGHEVRFMVNNFQLERDGDYVRVPGDRSTNQLVKTIKGDPRPVVGLPARNDVLTASLDYVAEDIGAWRLIGQLYYQDFEGRFEGGTFGGFFRLTPDGPPFLDQSQVVSEKTGLKLLASRNDLFNDKMALTVGFDLSEDSTAQELALSGREWVPNTDMTDQSPFVQVDIAATERLQINAGIRYESVELKVDDYVTIAAANSTPVAGGSPDFNETIPNIGLVFDVNDNWTLYTSFAEGFTIPDVGRILRNISEPGFSVETLIDLSPVVTDNTEIGARFDNGRFNFDISVYQSKSDLGARLQFTPDGANAFVAREKTEINGFDIAANFRVNDSVMIGGNYANAEAEFDSDDDGSVDTDLDGVNLAPNKLVLYVSAELPNDIFARLDTVTLFERDFRGPGIAANRLGLIDFDDGFTLVNLTSQMKTDIGTFSLGIRNLLNEQYVAYFAQVDTSQSNNSYFAGRGRTWTVAYSKSF